MILPILPKLLVIDFDGVMTDNRVLVSEDGQESVWCNRADGWGVSLLRQREFPVVVLSTEKNPVVRTRCDKLKIPCYHGCEDKLTALHQIALEHRIPLSEIVYLGNDMNDAECLQAVGCAVIVQDAHSSVRSLAHVILKRNGGDGAVREVCDLILDRLNATQTKESL